MRLTLKVPRSEFQAGLEGVVPYDYEPDEDTCAMLAAYNVRDPVLRLRIIQHWMNPFDRASDIEIKRTERRR